MTDHPSLADYAAVRIAACECIDCPRIAVQAEDRPCHDCGGMVLPILCGVCCQPLSTLEDPDAVCHLSAGPVHAVCCPDEVH